MQNTALKVLAVADPAVMVYVDSKYDVLSKFEGEVVFDIVPWEDYYTTMLAVFKGEKAYDIVMIAGHLWLCDFVQKGYLAPVGDLDEDILPVIAKEMSYEGTVYLSPSFCDGHMIVYRKSIIEKALGKALEEVISADTYIELIKKLQDCSSIPPIALKAHPSEIFLDAIPYMRSNGKDIYDELTLSPCAADEGVIRGLEKYCQLKAYAPSATDTYGNDEIREAIAHKDVATAVTWSGQLGVVLGDDCVDKEDLGFATFDTAWNVTWSFAISANSQNKDKARELLSYLRSKEVDKLVGEYCGAPIRKSTYKEGANKYPWYNCQLNMIEKYAKPLPHMPLAGDKNGYLYEEISQAFGKLKMPKEAMLEAQKKIEKLM